MNSFDRLIGMYELSEYSAVRKDNKGRIISKGLEVY